MRKILLVFKREYLTRVKKKSFLIITLMVPLSFVILTSVMMFIMSISSDSLRIAVVDDSGKYAHRLKDTKNLHFKKSTESLDAALKNYQEKEFDGVLHIPEINIDQPKGLQYHSENLLGMTTKTHIERELEEEIRMERIAKIGIDEAAYQKASKVDLNIKELGKEGQVASTGIATTIGMFMGFAMYFVIFIYGSMVMRGVMEEKTNRIVEVILSSVKPFELMMGKILGIGAVGLTQFFIWGFLMFFINIIFGLIIGGSIEPTSLGASEADMAKAMEMMEGFQLKFDNLPWTRLFFGFIFYFFFGYVIYAALFAAIASAIDDESDAQTLSIPVSIPVVISLFILMGMLESPNSGLAFWSSMFPLSSPIIMPARIAFGVPLWQLLLSMVIMIAGCIFAIWIAAKIYRTGILLYGKKITFRELAKWVVR